MLCASQPQPLPGAARSCLRSLRRCRGFARGRGRGRGVGRRLACLSCQFFSRPRPGTLSCPTAPRVCPGTVRLRRQTGLPSAGAFLPLRSCRLPLPPTHSGARRERPWAPRKKEQRCGSASVPLGQLRGHAELPGDPPAPPSPTCCPAPRGWQQA